MTTEEAVKLADDSRAVVLNHLRQWAEDRLKVACGIMRSSTIQRQKWQQRGRAETVRDLLHHLDTLQKERPLDPHAEEPEASEPPEGVPGGGESSRDDNDRTTQGDPG